MIDIVSGEHADDMLDGFLAAFGMHSIMLPLFWRERLEQREVRFPKHAELFEGFAGIAFLVVPADDPGILIEGGYRSSRRTQNESHAKAANDFRIGKVRENFAYRPFVRSGTLAQPGGGNSGDEARESLRGCGLNRQRLLALGVAADALNLLLGGFFHFILVTFNL